jgi:tRNA-2-methylthio-N6-dimethylallyladenosine synthase
MFSFLYSPRPHTEAAEFTNVVDKEVAKKRLYKLQALQKEILDKKSKEQIGKTMKVLIEEYKDGIVSGKSDNFYTVKAKGNENLLGKIIDIKITESHLSSLTGEI